MKIIDQMAIDRCKARCVCEYCGEPGNDPHHVTAKGMGGCQIDHDLNLLTLCRACHTKHHSGLRPGKVDCLTIIACREGVSVATITNFVTEVSRLPKGSPAPRYRKRPTHARNHRAASEGEAADDAVQTDKAKGRRRRGKPGMANSGGWIDL